MRATGGAGGPVTRATRCGRMSAPKSSGPTTISRPSNRKSSPNPNRFSTAPTTTSTGSSNATSAPTAAAPSVIASAFVRTGTLRSRSSRNPSCRSRSGRRPLRGVAAERIARLPAWPSIQPTAFAIVGNLLVPKERRRSEALGFVERRAVSTGQTWYHSEYGYFHTPQTHHTSPRSSGCCACGMRSCNCSGRAPCAASSRSRSARDVAANLLLWRRVSLQSDAIVDVSRAGQRRAKDGLLFDASGWHVLSMARSYSSGARSYKQSGSSAKVFARPRVCQRNLATRECSRIRQTGLDHAFGPRGRLAPYTIRASRNPDRSGRLAAETRGELSGEAVDHRGSTWSDSFVDANGHRGNEFSYGPVRAYAGLLRRPAICKPFHDRPLLRIRSEVRRTAGAQVDPLACNLQS